MSRPIADKTRAEPSAKHRVSDEMKQQLKSVEKNPNIADLKVVTFDSDIDKTVPDPAVLWEKSTCC